MTTLPLPRCACLGRGTPELAAGTPLETCPVCSGVRPMLLVDPKLEVRLRAVRNYALVPYITSGEYDDNAAESDAWASRQTGELGTLIDALGLR